MPSHPEPVVLVTGAARRVGAVIARVLHGRGCRVVLHYRGSAADAQALAVELEQARPGSTALVQADLADPAAPALLVQAALDRFARLDGLVNNASAFRPTPVGEIGQDDWDDLFASNARAPLFLSQAAAPHLAAAEGAIVNLVDIYAERPLPRHTVYVMAKAALAAMTLSLARELGPAVRVNGVAPGAVMWPEEGKAYADQQALLAGTALKRMGRPEDVAGAVAFLLLDAPYVTGEILRVDGGRWLAI